MKLRPSILSLLSTAVLLSAGALTHAQDKPEAGKEPIVDIDVSKLTYDILVDADLPQDDPANHKFKTLPAAVEAAQPGTEGKPTVIGIKPNVYQLPGGNSGASLRITKNWITLLGLTNNRRTVVLADNRGHSQGASDNGYIVDVAADGFTLKNLTILNYCNADYEYPGNPSKNLKMRGPTITQAVAFQSSGDKHVYENVAFLSRLDTCFLRTTRSYLKNVYIEGTDDFIGGGQVAVWEDCKVVFPTGGGVCAASNIVFINTTFEAPRGMQFSKSAGRGVVLINCTMPANTACVRGEAPPRPTSYYLTYHTKDASGKPAVITDGSNGPRTTEYVREISDEELKAFNPWNILRQAPDGAGAAGGGGPARGGRGAPGAAAPVTRADDDWDPSHTREKYEAAGQGSLIYRMALNNATPSIRTEGEGATIGAGVSPSRVADQTIRWSTKSNLLTLSGTTGPNVTVTGKNTTGKAEWVPITATAANGAYLNAYVYVEPKYIASPAFTAAPKISAPTNGKLSVDYSLDLKGNQDQSVISWYVSDDAKGANARQVATSRGNLPLKQYTLTSGDVGKYVSASIAPKHQVSDPGAPVSDFSAKPIATSDVPTLNIDPDFRNFVVTPNESYVNGRWTVLGTWTPSADEDFHNGYGLRAASRGAALFYQQDAPIGDMQVDLIITPEKAGMVFGSAGSASDDDAVQKSDVYIKYDPRTRTGYSLRFWRTTESASKCRYQLFKVTNGATTPLSDKAVLIGVMKPSTTLTLKVTGNKFSVSARNDLDSDTLSLEETITPNTFGGAGVYFTGTIPRGNSIAYSQFKITYPGK